VGLAGLCVPAKACSLPQGPPCVHTHHSPKETSTQHAYIHTYIHTSVYMHTPTHTLTVGGHEHVPFGGIKAPLEAAAVVVEDAVVVRVNQYAILVLHSTQEVVEQLKLPIGTTCVFLCVCVCVRLPEQHGPDPPNTRTHTYIHTHAQTHTRTSTHTHTHARIRTHPRTRTHTRTHTPSSSTAARPLGASSRSPGPLLGPGGPWSGGCRTPRACVCTAVRRLNPQDVVRVRPPATLLFLPAPVIPE
jgi:hypothetical protein